MHDCARVSAIVTAFREKKSVVNALTRIRECDPAPDQILVHVDGNERETAEAIQVAFPEAIVLVSQQNLGPGGGRNKLLAAASNEIVASFDDDSYPLDADYFKRITEVARRYPDAAIYSAALFHPDETTVDPIASAAWSPDFAGGAAVYRRSVFLSTTGYIPLPDAYGMEEVDLALRYHAAGHLILRTGYLRVYHDSDRSRHVTAPVNAAVIANIALLSYLRYPWFLWPIGLLQCLSRVVWCLRNKRLHGLIKGGWMVLPHCFRHRNSRAPVPASKVISFLKLRRVGSPAEH